LRDFGEEGSSIRGRFVLEGLSALSGDVGEVEDGEEGDKGELLVPLSGGQWSEAVLVWTERGAGNFEGLGGSSWMAEGEGWEQTMSAESQESSESALRLRGREWRGIDW
jgi:hypothetical protein